jgi:hypothetical protein
MSRCKKQIDLFKLETIIFESNWEGKQVFTEVSRSRRAIERIVLTWTCSSTLPIVLMITSSSREASQQPNRQV